MLGMGRARRLRYAILPATLGEALIGLRVALMAGWGTVIIAELVAADAGLGARLVASQRSFDISAVMATMVCFGAFGFLLDATFSRLQVRLVPWQERQ
jgi:ABC-type nitrate/sulfonate/bicarbonate transport system permease component